MNLLDNLIVDLIYSSGDYTMSKITFITDDSKIVNYDNIFKHSTHDGVSMSSVIKQNKCKPTSVKQTTITSNDIKNSYDYLNYERVEGYTSFTSTIAGYLIDYMKETNTDYLKICIVINTRKYTNDPMKLGNYIKPVMYTVKKSMTIDDICKLHAQSIDNVTSSINDTNAHLSLSDLISSVAHRFNFMFIQNRDICQIKRDDGVNLNLCLSQDIKDIDNIKKHSCHIIYIGNFDNKWMIMSAINYDYFNIIECLFNQYLTFVYSKNVILR